DRLDELVGRSKATHVVVALSGRPARRLRPRMALLSNPEIAVHWVGDEPSALDLPGVEHADTHRSFTRFSWPIAWGRLAKRAVDIVASALGLIVLSPLFALVA